jgi:hypothetical protein
MNPTTIIAPQVDYIFQEGYDAGREQFRRLFKMEDVPVPFAHRGPIDSRKYINGFMVGNKIAYLED